MFAFLAGFNFQKAFQCLVSTDRRLVSFVPGMLWPGTRRGICEAWLHELCSLCCLMAVFSRLFVKVFIQLVNFLIIEEYFYIGVVKIFGNAKRKKIAHSDTFQ